MSGCDVQRLKVHSLLLVFAFSYFFIDVEGFVNSNKCIDVINAEVFLFVEFFSRSTFTLHVGFDIINEQIRSSNLV